MDELNRYFERYVQHLKLYLIYSNRGKKILEESLHILEMYVQVKEGSSDLIVTQTFFEKLYIEFLEEVLKLIEISSKQADVVRRVEVFAAVFKNDILTISPEKSKTLQSNLSSMMKNATHKNLVNSYVCYRNLTSSQ